jgi:hypothetical protein
MRAQSAAVQPTVKRLFIIQNERSNKVLEGAYYQDKTAAKGKRDELNGGLSSEEDETWNKDKGWRVALGPDHWRSK